MPLTEEQKVGLLQNTTVGMRTAQQMLKGAAQGDTNGGETDIVAALSVQNLLLATFAQAFLLNIETRLVEPAATMPKRTN